RGRHLAEVDAEDGRVPTERRPFRPRVEEHRVRLVADVRRDEQRQAVMRAADRRAGQLGETSGLTEACPFGNDMFRRCGEAVGDVVDEDEDVEAIDLTKIGVSGAHRRDSTSRARRWLAGGRGVALPAAEVTAGARPPAPPPRRPPPPPPPPPPRPPPRAPPPPP